MLYKNLGAKKVRNAFLMLVSCNYCDYPMFYYQKHGKGNLRRLHLERVLESNVDFYHMKVLRCARCQKEMGVLKTEKNHSYFQMIPSTYNTKIIHQ